MSYDPLPDGDPRGVALARAVFGSIAVAMIVVVFVWPLIWWLVR